MAYFSFLMENSHKNLHQKQLVRILTVISILNKHIQQFWVLKIHSGQTYILFGP